MTGKTAPAIFSSILAMKLIPGVSFQISPYFFGRISGTQTYAITHFPKINNFFTLINNFKRGMHMSEQLSSIAKIPFLSCSSYAD